MAILRDPFRKATTNSERRLLAGLVVGLVLYLVISAALMAGDDSVMRAVGVAVALFGLLSMLWAYVVS